MRTGNHILNLRLVIRIFVPKIFRILCIYFLCDSSFLTFSFEFTFYNQNFYVYLLDGRLLGRQLSDFSYLDTVSDFLSSLLLNTFSTVVVADVLWTFSLHPILFFQFLGARFPFIQVLNAYPPPCLLSYLSKNPFFNFSFQSNELLS